jgi:hypothetical protein
MCQACRRFIEDGVNEEVLDKPEAVRVLKGVLEMINTGLISASHAETLIGKGFRQNRYTIYDAWVFAQLHVRYFTGFLLTQFVPFTKRGVTPFPDKEIAKNNEALSWLPKPFRAEFSGGNMPGDGYIDWTEPIPVRQLFQNPWTGKIREKIVTLEPGGLVLEVGSSSHYCTWHHMWDSHGLARWPYGHEYITLLKRDRSWAWDGGKLPLNQAMFDFAC